MGAGGPAPGVAAPGAGLVYVCQYELGRLVHEEALSPQDLEQLFGPTQVGGGGRWWQVGGAVKSRGGHGVVRCAEGSGDVGAPPVLPPCSLAVQDAEEKKRRLRRGRKRRTVRLGETIFKGHRSFDLMLNLQVGPGLGVVGCRAVLSCTIGSR